MAVRDSYPGLQGELGYPYKVTMNAPPLEANYDNL